MLRRKQQPLFVIYDVGLGVLREIFSSKKLVKKIELKLRTFCEKMHFE